MEKWHKVAESIRIIDGELCKLCIRMYDAGIRKNDKEYKDCEKLIKISGKLRSNLEDEMFRQNPKLGDEALRIFYGKQL